MGFPHIIGSAKHYAIPHRFNLILDKQNEATATGFTNPFSVQSQVYRAVSRMSPPARIKTQFPIFSPHLATIRPTTIPTFRLVASTFCVCAKWILFTGRSYDRKISGTKLPYFSWCSWTIFALLYCTIHDIMIWSFVLKFRCHTQLEGGRRNNAERGLQMDFQRMWVNRKIWARRMRV